MFEKIVGLATILGTVIAIFAYWHHRKSKNINKESKHLAKEKIENEIPENNHTHTIIKERDQKQKNISPGLIDSPLKIWESIKKAKGLPPYQRGKMANNFVDLKVRWKGMLNSVSPKISEDETFISIKNEDWGGNFIHFYVRTSVYPELKVMHEKTPIEIEGDIADVSFDSIKLKNVKLFY
ncbi:MAG: hypothetical protein KAU58_01875 [Candidatus Omnitrophica bacterium]|nr:hypothetical protein [Candidatus Omnitrophota bacterium]